VAVVARLRAVVFDQLRAAQAAGPAPVLVTEPAPADAGRHDPDPLLAREEMPPSKTKRGKRGQAAGRHGQLLFTAAAEGDEAAVVRLLAAGADPNASATVQNQGC
jgi:hypothetical protein